MDAPKNIVLLVADSLRWDSVHAGNDHRLPYTAPRAIRFDQARSGGCWTLPATASMFTGLMPHEHGATGQTRDIHQHVPRLPERLRTLGYRTHMVTANVVTTDIFGLSRGFETVDRIWHMVPARHKNLFGLLALIGKPRLRRKLLSKDLLLGRLSEDLQAAEVWLQSTMNAIFDRARVILRANESRGARTFLFLNLMESHFPYHIGDTFSTSAAGYWNKARELYSLYHLVNQTRLLGNKDYIRPDMLALLRQRQRRAWERMAPGLDAFVQEMREQHESLVIFASDHGDNFGEQGWQYHFSNVNDAGNRVPLFWLSPNGGTPRIEHRPVSARDIFGSVLRAAGDRDPALVSLPDEPWRSVPVMQSYWYNNRGRTHARFRYNQFAFVADEQRYLYRSGHWYSAPITRQDEPEAAFRAMDARVDPLREGVAEAERLTYLRGAFAEFCTFSDRVMRNSLAGNGARRG